MKSIELWWKLKCIDRFMMELCVEALHEKEMKQSLYRFSFCQVVFKVVNSNAVGNDEFYIENSNWFKALLTDAIDGILERLNNNVLGPLMHTFTFVFFE